LLGGRSRDGVTVYGHANGETVPQVLDEVARFLDLGYRAVRVQVGIQGISSIYGVSTDTAHHESGYVPAAAAEHRLDEDEVVATAADLAHRLPREVVRF
jgi:mannonate dehydratase